MNDLVNQATPHNGTLTAFGSFIGTALSSPDGSVAQSIAISGARRLAHQLYVEECRASRERRDKWLALIAKWTEAQP